MALEERSAGMILYRDTDQGPLFLLLDYGKYWDYAKGHAEPGEDDLTAAKREVLEETGISSLKLVPGFRQQVVYFFQSRRGRVRKTVIFFLAQVHETNVQLSDEHVGYDWLSGAAAMRRLNYATARKVMAEVIDFLS